MKSVRTEWQNETSGARAAGNSRTPADDLVGGVRMTDCSERVPALVEHDECPQCGTPGWMTAPGRYTAVCGSFWSDAEVVTYSAPSCLIIEHKNDLLDERDERIVELVQALASREVAA